MSFGRNWDANCDKVNQAMVEDFELRKREVERLRDGKAKRQEVEEHVAMMEKDIRIGSSVPRLFTKVPLLSTSESAVQWYMTKQSARGCRPRMPSATIR